MVNLKNTYHLISKAISFLSNDNLTPKVFLTVFFIALSIAIILLLLYRTRFLRAIGLIVRKQVRKNYD